MCPCPRLLSLWVSLKGNGKLEIQLASETGRAGSSNSDPCTGSGTLPTHAPL